VKISQSSLLCLIVSILEITFCTDISKPILVRNFRLKFFKTVTISELFPFSSGKAQGDEKRNKKELERQLTEEAVANASPLLAAAYVSNLDSPTGNESKMVSPLKHARSATSLADISDPAVRKMLVTLICTLNASFPDYDFSGAEPADFNLVHCTDAMASIDEHVSTAIEPTPVSFLSRLQSALTKHLDLPQCEIYEYVCDIESGDDDTPVLWSLNYFFFNRKLKKLAFFTAWATRRSLAIDSDDENVTDPEGI
jgi:hypothetical protein